MNAPVLALPDFPGIDPFLQAIGVPWKVDSERVEKAYVLAYRLTQLGQHEQAGRLFCLLSFYRQNDVRFWQGAALCARKLKDYPTAVRAYLQCVRVAPHDNRYAFDVVDCLCLADERVAAIALLEEMVRMAGLMADEDLAARAGCVLNRLQGEAREHDA